jgi:hypothetical protein
MERLVSNPQLTSEMGCKAHIRVQEHFSAEVVGRSMTALYIRAASRSIEVKRAASIAITLAPYLVTLAENLSTI